jgi:hypothetical protein
MCVPPFFNEKNLYKPIRKTVVISDFILDIHQQNAQITNKVQSAPYHSHRFDYDKGLIAPC